VAATLQCLRDRRHFTQPRGVSHRCSHSAPRVRTISLRIVVRFKFPWSLGSRRQPSSVEGFIPGKQYCGGEAMVAPCVKDLMAHISMAAPMKATT
jgi:hypothetical protein